MHINIFHEGVVLTKMLKRQQTITHRLQTERPKQGFRYL